MIASPHPCDEPGTCGHRSFPPLEDLRGVAPPGILSPLPPGHPPCLFRPFLFGLVLVLSGCGGSTSPSQPPASSSPSFRSPITLPGDELLRLNEIRVIGTHNSYHIARPNPVTTELNYTLPPLEVQVAAGVRQFELDLHYNRDTGEIEVYHLPVVDEGTHCRLLRECLSILRQYSETHPGHLPLFIFLEPKDDLTRELWFSHMEELEALIRQSWKRERLFTPDDLKGNAPNLAQARREKGWPLLGEVRGKAIFVILDDSGAPHWLYTYGFRSLEGRLMFVTGGETRPYGAILKVDTPDPERIQKLIAEGFIVRTRADAEAGEAERLDYQRFERALASGAQIISTDYPLPHPRTGYVVRYPGGAFFSCHPTLAPPFCKEDWLE